MLPDKRFAGKSIKYGKGVRNIQDFTYSGNEITGANSPDRNNVGINNNLSIDEAFSVQKHKQATVDCIKNWIKKEKNVDNNDKNKIWKFGIQIEYGLKRKKKTAIINANGNLVICSAICWAKYLKNGFKGWIRYGDTFPIRESSSNVNTTQTTENCLTKKALKK